MGQITLKPPVAEFVQGVVEAQAGKIFWCCVFVGSTVAFPGWRPS
jgi:hypothetical protein